MKSSFTENNRIYYIHTFCYTFMKSITAIKEIRLQGTSLVVIATKELSMLGLKKDDKVKVTLEKIE